MTGNIPPIGIIGGMGPHAGLLVAARFCDAARAELDQERLPFVLLSYSDRIPDRTAYLTGTSPDSPAPAILEVAETASKLGIRLAGIACNTAHAEEIMGVVERSLGERAPGLQLLHLIRETVAFAGTVRPGVKRVGVLATLGTYRSHIYEIELERAGLEAVVPDRADREELVHRAIYDPEFGLKSHPDSERASAMVLNAIDRLASRGCDAVILGCTELSIALDGPVQSAVPLVDSSTALARALVRRAAPDRLLPWIPTAG